MTRYFGIEILRFFTSLSVLLYHYRHFYSPFNSFSKIDNKDVFTDLPFSELLNIFYIHGIYGVHVFYVISGFVFSYVYINAEKLVSGKEFFLNRFARLYPLHFITLIIIALLQYVSFFQYGSFQIVELNDLYHFTLQIFFISSWGFEEGHSFNAPIWSVSVEIAIYIIFFLSLIFLRKFKIKFVIAFSILLILIDKILLIEGLFLECARLFFSGVLVYMISAHFKNTKILFFVSIILIVVSFSGNYKTYLFCPSIVLFFSQIDRFIKKDSIKSLFNNLGNLTYSIYLIHVPLQIIIIMCFNLFSVDETIVNTKTFFFVYIISLMFISNICFVKYEKPLNYMIRNKFK
jgi:peptidoglycan/LPS O-acetylase OafA/YrhL